MSAGKIRTLKGDVAVDTLGLMLPHEHLFVDLRGPFAERYAVADPEAVRQVMQPYLDAIEKIGVTAFVDCAPAGVGRNVHVLRHIAAHTPIHIVVPTGVYKEGFIPADLQDVSIEYLADLWTREISEGMDGTDSRAGFIKVALVDHGPTAIEERNLKGAAAASQRTGAVIASHTIGGKAARAEMDILEAAGLDLGRFIWVHAHTEPDPAVHVEAARRGAWVEFDAIGAESWHPQDKLLESVLALIEAGYDDHILLSHDAGWYEPGQPGGLPKNGVRGYTALFEQFIPALRARGVRSETIYKITHTNPAKAFAIQ
ncbi:MAG: esterase [Anaerolineae bacterium]|nr:esterase [Anaerolineae bacterium]